VSRYLVNEMFASLQGEGIRAGTAAIFLRFAKCNLACSIATGEGFDCDTDFAHGDQMTVPEILGHADDLRGSGTARWIICTGGEPTLQLDAYLIDALHTANWKLAIETNGTRPLLAGIDWICCSPKPGHRVVLPYAHEWKFVMGPHDLPPAVPGEGGALLLSPRWIGDKVDPAALANCIALVQAHSDWRLSCQQHKWCGVR
jgi:7-carboxy-7-deazaguanine synthase